MFIKHFGYGQSAAERFFLAADGGEGGGVDTGGDGGALDDFTPPDETSIEAGKNQTRVEGEKAPDFSILGGKKTPSEEEEQGEEQEKEEKPAGEAPAKRAAPPKGTPKPPEPAKKPETGKETAPKPAQDKEEKPQEGKKDAKAPKLLSEEEIEALQPKPGVPTAVHKDYKAMKEVIKTHRQAAQEALAAREAAEKQLAELQANSGKLPEDVAKDYEEAKKIRALFAAQQDPLFRQQFDTPIEKATDGVLSLLKAHKLSELYLNQIKAAAESGDIQAWPHWTKLLTTVASPIDRQKLINAVEAQANATAARQAKLNEVSQSREGYMQEMEKQDKAWKDQWAKDLETHAQEIGKDFEPAMEKEYPDGATPEVKKAIDAHNARVKEVAEAFRDNTIGAFKRDPKVIAKLAFDGVRADELARQLDEMKSELEQANKRAEAAESKLGKVKSAGRLGHIDTGGGGDSSRSKTTTPEGQIGGDGHSALTNFLARK